MPVDMSNKSESARRAAELLKGVEQEPGAAKPDPIVVADKVLRQFGGLTAVDVEHVEIQRGVITALIGPNGAGKTTFFNLLTGFDRPQTGDWSFNGTSLWPFARPARPMSTWLLNATSLVSKLVQSKYGDKELVTRTSCAAPVAVARFSK